MSNPTEQSDAVKVLTDDEVADVLKRARLANANWHSGGYVVELLKTGIPALCQTVRACKASVLIMQAAYDKTRGELKQENTVLREQLAQEHSDNERAALVIQNIEEREAAVCPEDVGFDEYLRSLQFQLAQVTQERNELRDNMKRLGRARARELEQP